MIEADGGEKVDYLSTGLEKLDEQLEPAGLRSGSIITLLTEPQGHGRRLAFNLCADRPVLYISLGHSGESYSEQIAAVAESSPDDIETVRIETSNIDQITTVISDSERLQNTTIVIDAMNLVEQRGASYVETVHDVVRRFLQDTGGLGILLSYQVESEPDARWLSVSSSDGVFRLERGETGNEITSQLLIERLPFGQGFRGSEDIRAYSVPLTDEDISLETSRKFSS